MKAKERQIIIMTFQELMDCCMISEDENNRIVYDQLLELFNKQRVTPIIGAGISHWVYPLWAEMLKKQANSYGLDNEIKELLEKNQYEDAASLLESEITHNGLIRLLKQIFNPLLIEKKADKCPEYLKNVPQLFCGPIVTTNFDRVIEYLFTTQGISEFDTVTPLDEFQVTRLERALSENSPILVKMHGDIRDPEHLVLTKESYNNVYGEDPDKPDFTSSMPTILKKILERNPILFLGCSLSADRTCSVIKSCALGHEQFAFLELPKDTTNEEVPCKPNLYGSDGKLVKAFRDRRNSIIGDFNIRAIWYPHGMHEEAYRVFFSKISEDLGINTSVSSIIDVDYALLHPLLGRNELVDSIVRTFMDQSFPCVWVDGAAGIGKTEVCKKVYAILKEKFPTLVMPYVDVTGISSLSALFDSIADVTHISIPNPINIDDVSQYLLERLKEKYSPYLLQNIPLIMYFDNWEDIWYSLGNIKEREGLIHWMRMLLANNIRILVSSRELPPSALDSYRCHVKPLDNDKGDIALLRQEEFDKLDSVKLFCNILGRNIVASEKNAFRMLIEQLEGHPLAIVLTATQAQREINLNDLLGRWDKAKQDTTGMRGEHKNLEVALKVSWNVIATNQEAIIQWGLLYYSLKAIPAYVFKQLRGNSTEEAWDEGFSILSRANLVYVTKNRDEIAMLLPLKKQFGRLVFPDKNIQESCLIRWAVYVEKLLDMAGKRLSVNRLSSHHQVVEFAPQIFYTMEQLMTFGTGVSYQYLNRIAKKVRYYYQFYVQSETLLKKLISHYEKSDSAGLLPIILEDYGNLLRRLGDLNGAKKAYDSAEPLYREKGNNKGRANLLKSRGDLLRRQGDLDGAKEAYDEAENRYRQEGDNLGLVNLLKSRGDLLRRLHDLNGAKEAYNEAEPIYRKECDNLGLADLLKSQGDLLSQMEILDEAEEKYSEAEHLYYEELDDLGLANLLKSRGDLLRQQGYLGRALKMYDRSEKLYRKEGDTRGIAYISKAKEDLLRRLKPE